MSQNYDSFSTNVIFRNYDFISYYGNFISLNYNFYDVILTTAIFSSFWLYISILLLDFS